MIKTGGEFSGGPRKAAGLLRALRALFGFRETSRVSTGRNTEGVSPTYFLPAILPIPVRRGNLKMTRECRPGG